MGNLRLIAGLGNPGAEYRSTRHNVGFMVADDLAQRAGIGLSRRRTMADIDFGRGRFADREVVVAKPTGYMNRSGPPILRLMHYFDIQIEDVIVIHDDIDLSLGRVKIKEKGGHGGHKGVKSIMEAAGRDDFVRLRIGVGRSERGATVTDHVLGRFHPDELAIVQQVREVSLEALETIVGKGAKEGMNRFNNTRMTSS